MFLASVGKSVDFGGHAYEELVKKGADVTVKPSDAKGTKAYIKGPDGIWIELLE